MPSLSSRSSSRIVKLLFLGDSGTGKTGALSSLVKQGYNLLVLDFDNGLDILLDFLTETEAVRVHFETLTDKMKATQGEVIAAGMPQAFTRAMDILTTGKLSDETLGPPARLGPDWIVVIDSLTHCARSAFRWQETVNSGLKDKRMVYFHAQNLIRGMLSLLYSSDFATHVIVNCHIDYVEDIENRGYNDKGEPIIALRGWPKSIGSAMASEIGTYFNTTLRAKTTGQGSGTKRVIKTVSEGLTDLKTSMPSKLKAEYPIGELASIFKVLTGRETPIQQKEQTT